MRWLLTDLIYCIAHPRPQQRPSGHRSIGASSQHAYRLIENVCPAVDDMARNFVVITTNASSRKANKYEIYFVNECVSAVAQRADPSHGNYNAYMKNPNVNGSFVPCICLSIHVAYPSSSEHISPLASCIWVTWLENTSRAFTGKFVLTRSTAMLIVCLFDSRCCWFVLWHTLTKFAY